MGLGLGRWIDDGYPKGRACVTEIYEVCMQPEEIPNLSSFLSGLVSAIEVGTTPRSNCVTSTNSRG